MPSILDIIKQRKQAAGTNPVSAQALAEQQATAQTGKAVTTGAGPAMSNVQAQMAAQATKAGQQQLATQGAIQNQATAAAEQTQNQQFQLAQSQQAAGMQRAQRDIAARQTMSDAQRAAQEQMAMKEMNARETTQMKQMSNAYAESLANLASERGIVEQDIFAEAARMRDQLDFEKYQAFLDQAGHVLAMTNQEYLDNLRRVGQEQRLRDQLAFRKEATQIAFGQDFQFLNQQFDQQRLLNSDRRDFERMMSEMDMNTAILMAEQAAKEQAYKNMIMGATSIGVGLSGMDWSSGGTGTAANSTGMVTEQGNAGPNAIQGQGQPATMVGAYQ